VHAAAVEARAPRPGRIAGDGSGRPVEVGLRGPEGRVDAPAAAPTALAPCRIHNPLHLHDRGQPPAAVAGEAARAHRAVRRLAAVALRQKARERRSVRHRPRRAPSIKIVHVVRIWTEIRVVPHPASTDSARKGAADMRIRAVEGSGDRNQSAVPGSGESVTGDAPAVSHGPTRPGIDGRPSPGRAVGRYDDREGAPRAWGSRCIRAAERIARWTGRVHAHWKAPLGPGLLLPLEPGVQIANRAVAV